VITGNVGPPEFYFGSTYGTFKFDTEASHRGSKKGVGLAV
jgi:hypothetical protein